MYAIFIIILFRYLPTVESCNFLLAQPEYSQTPQIRFKLPVYCMHISLENVNIDSTLIFNNFTSTVRANKRRKRTVREFNHSLESTKLRTFSRIFYLNNGERGLFFSVFSEILLSYDAIYRKVNRKFGREKEAKPFNGNTSKTIRSNGGSRTFETPSNFLRRKPKSR